ncbi:SDR family oxidoreductase [Nonomuraea sp. NPDC049152]|uniref:SDR family oxidoreductase n=1 Tax=Nonomuraea sp. NPDC049152 TaxID=3154350 RepID=UPI0034040DDD
MTKIALITGANKGIGFEIARQLAEQGVTTVIGARDETRGRAAAEQLGQRFVQLDVTDETSVRAAAEWIGQEHGGLDILVNNAGVITPGGGLPSASTPEAVRFVFETNVFGVITVTNAMLPLLLKSPAGRIVNVSSELGSLTNALIQDSPIWGLNDMPYNASKAAVNMITVSYAKELWDTAIKVNCIDPGWCATDINGSSGYRTAAQGAAVAVRLTAVEPGGPTATFVQEEGPLPW